MDVKVISQKGASALIEWAEYDGPHRAYVPVEVVVDGQVASDDLDAAIPFGAEWEALDVPAITAQDIARELRRRGIWTQADLRRQPNTAIAALQRIYGITLGALLALGKERNDNG